MSVITNNLLFGEDGYNISRSVRLRSSASAYFNRTPASAGNRKTWTWSGWVKLGKLSTSGADQSFFTAGYSSVPWFILQYQGGTSSGTIQVSFTAGSSAGFFTNAVYRDPSAWYHVVLAVDTTQATAANRVLLYVNGVLQSFASTNYPTQNYDTQVNSAVSHTIGGYSGNYLDGYLTEVNFIDGQALTPSSFGEFDAITGVWKPKKYTGTYGTNGFYLNFSDNSNNTAATIGKDSSGNGNNWTPNNISVTAGVTYDSMIDVPTMYADGGNGRGNYCVISPLWKGSQQTLSNANLTTSKASGTTISDVWGTFGMTSGKWYFECSVAALASTVYIGVGQGGGTGEALDDLAVSATSYFYGSVDGNKNYGGSSSAYGSTYTTGDVVGCAVDMDNGKIWWSKNGAWQASGDPAAGTNAAYTDLLTRGSNAFLAFSSTNGASNSNTLNWNFGQRPFSYTPPTGYLALNTQNLPDSTIKQGNKYFDATTYTGNGTSQSVVNSGSFQPDLVWTKSRTNPVAGYFHWLSDSVRGTSSGYYSTLSSNATDTENTYPGSVYGGVTALNSNGFSLGGTGFQNNSTTPYIGWQWKKGATQGFDIVTYTGTGSATTIAHSLGVAPKMIITKSRSDSTYGWTTYHASVGAGAALFLNTTGASNAGVNIWNNTAPTSSVFSVGSDQYANFSGKTYVAYCFAEVAGYSKFGSYTGNGSTDGPFNYCGFRPRFVLVKKTSATGNWIMYDTVRDTYNTMSDILVSNSSGAEIAGAENIDVLSNGFKLKYGGAGDTNTSGATYIYAAFAENPTKYSLAR